MWVGLLRRHLLPCRQLTPRSFLQETLEGFRFTWRDPVLRGMAIVAFTVTVGTGAIPAILPALVRAGLHAGVAVYGFMGAAAMAGSVLGGLSAGWVERRLSLGRVLVLALVAFGLAVGLVGLSQNTVLSLALWAAGFVATTLVNIPVQALLQARVPDEYMGRAFSFLGALEAAAGPASALAGGWLAEATSPGTVFLAAGAWTILTAALVLANPRIRDVRVAAESA